MASEYDAVNLGQGFPDFPPPDFALQAFQLALSSDFMLNQYTKAFVSFPASPGPWNTGLKEAPGEEGSSHSEHHAYVGVRVFGQSPENLVWL